MSIPPGVRFLLISNIALFLAYFIATIPAIGLGWLFTPFALTPAKAVEGLRVWQPFTYLFLHDPDGFGHIFFNMIGVYMFGRTLEEFWGTERFLRYYFICGVGAGLCVIVADYFTGRQNASTIGASGAIFGLLIAFGILFPDSTILLQFIVPIKAKYFVMIFGAITLLSIPKDHSGVSHIAHLGGMIVGFILLKTAFGKREMTRSRPSSASLLTRAGDAWREYKLRRARKKFQVYMSRQNRKDDPRVH